MKKACGITFCVGMTALCVLSIIYSKSISMEMSAAVTRCLTIIIPSLFFFMVLSDMIIKSGNAGLIARPFRLIAKYIFKMDDELFLVFLLSNTCGYPIGIKLIKDLLYLEKIDSNTADVMSCYCYASGPSFIIGLVGTSLFSSIKAGALIFLANLCANMTIAVVLNRIKGIKLYCRKIDNEHSKNTFFDSVSRASRGMFSMCSMIVVFSAIIGIIKGSGLINYISHNLIPLMEISYITEISNPGISMLPAISAMSSFGGVCVILQIKALVNKFSLKYLLLSRIPAMLLSFFFSMLWMKVIKLDLAASKTVISAMSTKITDNPTVIPSVLLVFMMFILIAVKEKD